MCLTYIPQTELQHRKIKAQWLRTNRREAVPQMTRVGDIADALTAIQERLNKRVDNHVEGYRTVTSKSDAEPYYIGQSDRSEDAINIPLWVHSQSGSPTVKVCFY
jgi:hypothetical protein